MLRNLKITDKNEFINMIKEFYSSEAVLHSIPQKNIETTFNEIMNSNPYVHGYMIEYNKSVAGYVLLALTYSNEAGGICVWIEEIFIKKEFRGKGLGKIVLNDIKEKYNNAKRFRLEVTKENLKAIKLYENLGYENLDYLQMIIDI